MSKKPGLIELGETKASSVPSLVRDTKLEVDVKTNPKGVLQMFEIDRFGEKYDDVIARRTGATKAKIRMEIEKLARTDQEQYHELFLSVEKQIQTSMGVLMTEYVNIFINTLGMDEDKAINKVTSKIGPLADQIIELMKKEVQIKEQKLIEASKEWINENPRKKSRIDMPKVDLTKFLSTEATSEV